VRIEPLWPPPPSIDALSDEEIAAIYTYPDLVWTKPWVRVNFVASLDGAVSINGRAGALSGPADKHLFRLLRALADVILVGAGTVRIEGYGQTHLDIAEHSSFRREHGLAPVPPIAVVTRFADLDPGLDVFTRNVVAPIIVTSRAAPKERLAALDVAGADVVIIDDYDIPPSRVLEELSRRGLRRVLCEGGTQLFSSLLTADAVDELCLTLTPILVSGDASRLSYGPTPLTAPARMRLASVLLSHDALLLRYQRGAQTARPGGQFSHS
jgi:5-amino-6-(5-phosphoribosylamino)uracil reductase